MSYIDGADVTRWAGTGATVNRIADDLADTAATVACAAVDAYCARNFDAIDGDTVASARLYRPTLRYVLVDDIATTTGLVVVEDGTTIAAADYVLRPYNGIGPDGRTGWPYTMIELASGREWVTDGAELTVSVTAKWGWTATPEAVKHAALIIAGDLYANKDVRFGATSFGDGGIIRIRENSQASLLLRDYVRQERKLGIA